MTVTREDIEREIRLLENNASDCHVRTDTVAMIRALSSENERLRARVKPETAEELEKLWQEYCDGSKSIGDLPGGIEEFDIDEMNCRAWDLYEFAKSLVSTLTPASEPDTADVAVSRQGLMDLMSDTLGNGDHLDLGAAADAILCALSSEQHPDDHAVDRFAAAMKAKMAKARAKGRNGWDDPEKCATSYLVELLYGHLQKDNPGNFEDVANLCMMLHQRGAHPKELSEGVALLRTPSISHRRRTSDDA